jgi:hypothetical protein
MGYCADTEQMSGEIVLAAKDMPRLIEGLRLAESKIGHISWCNTIDEYILVEADPTKVVAQLLADYGFLTELKDSNVVLNDWGGDKIGMSWDEVWDAIGSVSTDSITWIMRGEDNEMWAETIEGGTHRQRRVVQSFSIQD